MSNTYDVGTKAWQPDQTEGWVASQVSKKSVDGDKVKLVFELENGETKEVETTLDELAKDSLNSTLPPLMNPAMLEASDDLTNLSHLNEPAVLQAIKLRYAQKEIYLVADYEQPINGEIMKAVASRVTDPKSDVLLLQAVDMEDSGPYEIAEPRVITALETYTPSWLQTPRLKRLAEIVSAQAVMQQQLDAGGKVDEDGEEEGMWNGHPHAANGVNGHGPHEIGLSDEEYGPRG